MTPSCPRAVLDLVGAGSWEPVPILDGHGRRAGERGRPGAADDAAGRWRVGSRWVVRAADHGAASAEAGQVAWLARRLDLGAGPAAGTVALHHDRWLVVDGPPGWPADQPDRHPEPEQVPNLVGRALRALHDLDPAVPPPARDGGDELAGLAAAAADGRIDPTLLPPPYDRYRPGELVELAGDGPGADPADDDPVVTHGSALVGHVIVRDGVPTGMVGLGSAAVADRHRDLATLHRHLQLLYGGEAVWAFYDGYGRDPDLVRLDRAILLDVLAGAVVGRAGARP